MHGLYGSDHALFGIEHIIARESDCSLADLMADEAEPRARAGDRSDAQIVKIGGILSGVQRKVTKQGNQWAAATLEDLGGAIEVLFFPQTYQLYATSIAEDAVVVVKGKVDRRDDVPKLIAMDLTIPDLSVDESGPFVVSMPMGWSRKVLYIRSVARRFSVSALLPSPHWSSSGRCCSAMACCRSSMARCRS